MGTLSICCSKIFNGVDELFRYPETSFPAPSGDSDFSPQNFVPFKKNKKENYIEYTPLLLQENYSWHQGADFPVSSGDSDSFPLHFSIRKVTFRILPTNKFVVLPVVNVSNYLK